MPGGGANARWSTWWWALTRFPAMIVHDLVLWASRRKDTQGLIRRQENVLRMAKIMRHRRRWWTLWSVLVPIPIAAAAVLVMAIPSHLDRSKNVLVARRSFYGVLRVAEYGSEEDGDWRRNLYNGRILHGVQYRALSDRDIPTTYYSEDSGLGVTLLSLPHTEPLRVATVGLGTGTIAAYGEQDDYYCFYEINPDVVEISKQYFTFVTDSPAEVVVKLGDARLSMEQQPPQNYDVIALDAFSGDAIPAHLLTVEAFAVYQRHLKPNGVIVVHTSNRHLNLRPIVVLLAEHYSMQVVAVDAEDAGGVGDSSSEWMLVTNNQEFLDLEDVRIYTSSLVRPDPSIRVWTDQYSNLFQILTMWDDWRSKDSEE